MKDDSLSDSDNLPLPEVIAAEIIEDLQAALDQLKELEADLPSQAPKIRHTQKLQPRCAHPAPPDTTGPTPWTPAPRRSAFASNKPRKR